MLRLLIESFRLSLTARNLSRSTIAIYTGTARRLVDYLEEHNMPTDPTGVTREHLELFLTEAQRAPITRNDGQPRSMTVKLWHASLRAFFGWLVDVDEIRESPMDRVKAPKAAPHKRPVLTHDQVKAVLRACEGKTFKDRRDTAIILLFIDTGLRVAEMADLLMGDIDWQQQQIEVRHGKGDKRRTVYFGKRTARALDSYTHLKGGRRDHPYAHSRYLWLGQSSKLQGRLTDAGISQMLKYRGQEAGIPNLHPHLWRHYFIHSSLQAGVQLGDLQRQTGHSKLETLLGYADQAADERARESHRRLGPGDRL